MRAVLLDGSRPDDRTGERVRAALTAQLEARGWEVEHVALCEKQIGNCGGEFHCWVKHPGVCMWDDDNRTIAAAIVDSDLTVYLTPVTFGGYSSMLKRMVDHQIQNISPFFAKIEGETHHRKRYNKNPDLLAIGWMDAPGSGVPDARSEALFQHLSARIAINWHAETSISDVVLASHTDEELATAARQWVSDVQDGRSSPRAELPAESAPEISSDGGEVRRALLLVGSPRTRKSTSNALGTYLFEQLDARSGGNGHEIERAASFESETIYLHTALRSPERTQALLDAVDAADLVALTFPLYVDSLPAPVIEALERIAAHRQGHAARRRTLFTALVNSGFPEAHHNATALAICETFGREAGFEWAGGLALGGGGMVGGLPLAEGGGKTMLMRRALDLAAEALVQGRAIPAEAQELLGKPLIPAWAYRRMGDLGWILGAKEFSSIKRLRRRPYPAQAN